MCGIGGILRVTPAGEAAAAAISRPLNEAIPEAWLDVLDESIRHRGPDGQGRFRDRVVRADGSVVDVALVHRRLSIIDHAGGAQPMVSVRGPLRARGAPSASSGDSARSAGVVAPLVFHGRPNDSVVYSAVPGGRPPELALGAPSASADLVAVVFNGCIYNHRELRKELQAAGHEFVTDHSDTEVLIHGWRQWGRGTYDDNDGMPIWTGGLFERLEDMFAVAIWDRASAMLVLARDHFGQKPLYVLSTGAESASIVAFGSCVPGLTSLQHRLGIPVQPEANSVVVWARFGADRGSRLGGGDEVEPSTAQVYGNRAVDVDHYVPPAIAHHMVGVLTAAKVFVLRRSPLGLDAVDRLLRHAVTARLEADVTVGCFLSGGVDSSLVAKYARECDPRLQTFTVKMPAEAFDESAHASAVARVLGTDHHTLDCAANPSSDLIGAIHQLGLPFGDSSLLPATWLSRAVREHVPVALAGDGGDEHFAGYDRYVAANLLQLWPLLALLPVMPRANPRSRQSRLARLANAARHDRYRDLVSIFPTSMLSRLVGARRSRQAFEVVRRFGSRVNNTDGAIAADLGHYLQFDLMRKADTASMCVALELREPFLDATLAAAAQSASLRSLMPHGQRKGLLRQVARKYVPADIVDRPKMGFAIPIGEWFRTDYGGMRTLLLDRLNSREPFGPDSLGINAMINMEFVRQMLREHDDAGQRSIWPWKGRDHSQRLYMLLVLSIWADWLGGVGRG